MSTTATPVTLAVTIDAERAERLVSHARSLGARFDDQTILRTLVDRALEKLEDMLPR